MHAPAPKFGMDIFNSNFSHEGVVLLSNNGEGNKGIPIRCDHYIIILCLEGEAYRRINQHRFWIKRKSMHLMKPGDIHSFSNATSDFSIQILLIDRSYLQFLKLPEKVLAELTSINEQSVPNVRLSEIEFDRWIEIFAQLNSELKTYLSHQTTIVIGLLFQIFGLIKRELNEAPIAPQGSSRQDSIFIQFKKLIEEHFIKAHTVQEYAQMLNLTSKHLSETIKQLTGQPALYYIHERLIHEAEYLLTYSESSISEIAYSLHFDTPSHFGRFFKKHKSATPSVYRIRNQIRHF